MTERADVVFKNGLRTTLTLALQRLNFVSRVAKFCICRLNASTQNRSATIVPGVEDEFLQLARGRMQFLEDDVAAGERLQPVGEEPADEHQSVGGRHYRQVHAGRRARHLRPRHHGQHERAAMTSRAGRDDVTNGTIARGDDVIGQHERVAADADGEDDRCAEDPQRGDQVETTTAGAVRRRRRVAGGRQRRQRHRRGRRHSPRLQFTAVL